MFKNEATMLKKENNAQSISLDPYEHVIIRDIMGSMSIFKVNSYDAEVIRRDLIGMSQELSLRESTFKQSIGDNITAFTHEIIKNSSGPSIIEIFIGLLAKISGFIFMNFIILSSLAYGGITWSVKPLLLFFYIIFYSILFITDGILSPIFSTKKGLIRIIPSIIGILFFLIAGIITEFFNHGQTNIMISASYVIIISGLVYLISKYLYSKHIHELAKGKINFIQDLI